MTAAAKTVDSALRFVTALGIRAGSIYSKNESWFRKRADARCVTSYDDATATFAGDGRNSPDYSGMERSLRLLWKAELEAPYLGLHDATKSEKHGHAFHDDSEEIFKSMEFADACQLRNELSSAFSSQQCDALNWILSLVLHGEAYALFLSSSLVPFASGTSSKLSLSMQVVEEAKHYIVMRKLSEVLFERSKPLRTSARIFMEAIARCGPYNRLFGLNIMMESFAMEFFTQFSGCSGFGSLLQKFLLDESRHCAFPQNYARLGFIPKAVRDSSGNRLQRTRITLLALPIVFEYAPYFRTLGMDGFQFFSKVLVRSLRLAEASDMPLVLTADQYLALANITLNSYLRSASSGEYQFKDYCGLNAADAHRCTLAQRWYWSLYYQAIEAIKASEITQVRDGRAGL